MAPKNDLGPTGQAVADNVRRLREQQRITYAELSRKTVEMGYPIAVLALAHIERGKRRVDVDDLVVLAQALDVAPIALLMPSGDDPKANAAVTGIDGAEADRVWKWMRADFPLLGAGDGPVDPAGQEEAYFQNVLFRRLARPAWARNTREIDLDKEHI